MPIPLKAILYGIMVVSAGIISFTVVSSVLQAQQHIQQAVVLGIYLLVLTLVFQLISSLRRVIK